MAEELFLRIDGSDLRSRIGAADVAFEKKALAAANKKAAAFVAEKAQPLVPVRTGRLRKTVRALATAKKGNVRAGSAAVPYAAAVHWGRGRRTQRTSAGIPYLWNAQQDALRSGELADIYEQSCVEVLDQFF